VKLGCIGDVHLGAGVARFGPERLADQEQVLVSAFETFRDERCDAVLVAGDTWHGPIVPPEQYVVFARALRVLDGIPVVMVNGNGVHDLAMRDTNALRVFEETYTPERLTIRCEPDLVNVFPSGVSVACLPWASVKRLVAAHGGGDRDDVNAYAAELLVEIARGLREDTAGPCVLLTHFSISGAALPNGLPVDSLREPVLDLSALEDCGFDAIVAGHIHKPQRLDLVPAATLAEGAPQFYVGSPMPLDFGEAGTEHGCWILDVGVATEARFVPLPSRPFRTLDILTVSLPDEPFVLDGVEVDDDLDGAIVRVRYRATDEQARRIDQAAIRRALLDAGAHRVFMQPEIIRAERARVAALDETISEEDALLMWLASQGIDPVDAAVVERHRAYVEAVA
jgi:DNA repair exonuclease SbcCD nuclease subunit